MLKATLDSLVNLFGEEHLETLMHMYSCKEIMRVFAQDLQMSLDEITLAEQSAFYHDVGKVFFRTLAYNSCILSQAEYDVIKEHTTYGAKALLECTNLPKEVVETAKYHHERRNGTGYYGLLGVEIPLMARIMAIIDVYDAIRGKRTYRPSMNHSEALLMIDNSDWFDPSLIDTFIAIPQSTLDGIIAYYHDETHILEQMRSGNMRNQFISLT